MSLAKRIRRIAKAKWRHLSETQEQVSPPTPPSRVSQTSGSDPYHVLEIDQSATWDEIQSAYRRLSKKYHPDRFIGDEEKLIHANRLMAEINSAFNVLKRQNGR